MSRGADLSWEEFLSADAAFSPLPCDPEAPTTILFSSGTTGEPKAIPWTHTTPVKCAADGWLPHDIAARRRGGMAHQPGMDDGSVADLRQSHQPGHRGAVRRSPHRPRVREVRAGCRRHHARSGAQSGTDVAQQRLHGGTGLERNPRLQLHRRALQWRRLPVPDGLGRLPPGDRVLRRHRDRRRLPHRHRGASIRPHYLHDAGAGDRLSDSRRRRPARQQRRGVPAATLRGAVHHPAQPGSSRGVLRRYSASGRNRTPAAPRRPDRAAFPEAAIGSTDGSTTP